MSDRCREDAALRARINALLVANDLAVAHEGTASFGGADGSNPEPTADFPGKDERVGAVLAGKYKLIEQIGEGGMGSVFMAQQTEPVKRAVAVKVIFLPLASLQRKRPTPSRRIVSIFLPLALATCPAEKEAYSLKKSKGLKAIL